MWDTPDPRQTPPPAPKPQPYTPFTPNYQPPARPSGPRTLDLNTLKGLIGSDPGYLQFMAGKAQTLAGAEAQRRAQMRALAVQHGGLGGFSDTYGDIDQATLDAAKANQFSDVNKISRGYNDTVEGTRRQLAARHALQSGDLTYGMGQADLARGSNEYDAQNSFAAAARNAIDNYSQTVAQQQEAEAQAIWAAENSIAGWWTPPSEPDAQSGSPFVSWQGTGPGGNASLGALAQYWQNLGSPTTIAQSQAAQKRYKPQWYRDPETGQLYQG